MDLRDQIKPKLGIKGMPPFCPDCDVVMLHPHVKGSEGFKDEYHLHCPKCGRFVDADSGNLNEPLLRYDEAIIHQYPRRFIKRQVDPNGAAPRPADHESDLVDVYTLGVPSSNDYLICKTFDELIDSVRDLIDGNMGPEFGRDQCEMIFGMERMTAAALATLKEFEGF